MLNGEATNVNYLVLGITRPGLELPINHFNTDVITWARINLLHFLTFMSLTLNLITVVKNIFKIFTCNISHAFSLNRNTLLHLNVSMSKMPSIAKTINVNIICGSTTTGYVFLFSKGWRYIQNIRHFDFGTDFITGYIRWAGTASLIYPVINQSQKQNV